MPDTLDDDDLSCLIGETINVNVGPNRKCYTVHKGLLTQHEWFRLQIYLSSTDTVSQRSISFPSERPEAFELLITWLYRKKLKAISTTDEKIAAEEVTLYVDLYLRACAWEIYELQNALVDQLRARQTCVYGFFPRKLIHKIYRKTTPQSPLRSYIVDSFLYKSVEWNEDEGIVDPTDGCFDLTRKRALGNQLDAGNHDFVLDCYEALFQLCAKSKIRDPDRRIGCVYHTHEDWEKCGA